ncbi:hypothetical protein CANCADRAFT_107152 [Tortispora caseinolytica NRRL Y-17796]|uniref:Diacylglycerol O-acyltransferase n=1 Tax=Tortispora caseinolytica NRRL Y-17796 TaxID=767744 RepID=A0A1E4TFH3_9ASCO|nr:hypothetical protein CANCADRAFT_107152 [Tortispora caseinolytica NRRL Y-17796]
MKERRLNGPKFAPITVPASRRLQTLTVFCHVAALWLSTSIFFLCCAIPLFWPFIIAYLFYLRFERSYSDGSGKRCEWIRYSRLGKWFCDFFPLTLIRTVPLAPTYSWSRAPHSRFWPWVTLPKASEDKPRYVFGIHPHGIIALSIFGVLSTEGRGWSKLFPGIPTSLLTLDSNFRVPFYRDYLQAFGLSSVSKESCLNLLKRGSSICIVVGGAQESLLAHPGQMEIILRKRKGFVKIAMSQPNVHLVPILAFGENDLYDQVENDPESKLYRLQTFIKSKLGFAVPLMYGRGVFNYDFGLLPYRRPVKVVVGNPIAVPYLPDHPVREIERIHGLYVDELMRIWNENKDSYMEEASTYLGPESSLSLDIIE